MSGSREHLIYMANQIARNLAINGEAEAAQATAEHIRAFWEPRMRAEVLADRTGLDPIAARAFDLIASG